MRIRLSSVCLAFALVCAPAVAAQPHPCAADAAAQARKLLDFYVPPVGGVSANRPTVDENIRKVGKVAAITGKRRYDVLEVWGGVYKGRYRMRFDYLVAGGECVLMGEHIVEDAVP